jgi:hypothetical protein
MLSLFCNQTTVDLTYANFTIIKNEMLPENLKSPDTFNLEYASDGKFPKRRMIEAEVCLDNSLLESKTSNHTFSINGKCS